MLVSIVIPCYNSQQTISHVVELTLDEFEKLPGYTCEFILVNDNSHDDTFSQIRRLASQYANVRGINLMRNFGQHNALMAGMNYTSGDLILGMDDDMQTHPSQIHKLLEKIASGYDLVYGVYPRKKNSAAKNFSSWLNQVSSRILLGRPKDIVSSNYWVITRAVRDEVIKYTGFNPYVDGIFYRVTTNIGNVDVEHHRREVGSSNYTLRKLFRLWLAYWNYSVIPLRIASVLGGVSSFGGLLFALIIVIRKILNPGMTVGWASMMSAMMFFFGLVLLVLGIIGEYLGKVLLVMSDTPQYIIRETVNLEKNDGSDTLH